MTWQELSTDSERSQIALLRALRKRGAARFFEKEWAATRERTERQPLRHVAHFRRQSQLFLEFNESAKRQRRGDALFFQEMTDALTVHTLAEQLRHGCALLSHAAVSGRAVDFGLLEATFSMLEREPKWLAEPVVAAYFQVHRSMTAEEPEPHFEALKGFLQADWAVFPADERRDLYLFAINFCIKKSNEGQKQFVREAFELYQFGLEKGLLLENGQLSPYAYNNVMLIGLSLGETVWARDFLEKWKAFLPERDRENDFQHNLAQLFFRTKDYSSAMELLQKTEHREPLRFLDSRRMLARIYFELAEWAALDSLLDALRTYLYRKNGLGYHRSTYLVFIGFLKKMASAQPTEREILKKKARAAPNLLEREWILEMLGRR